MRSAYSRASLLILSVASLKPPLVSEEPATSPEASKDSDDDWDADYSDNGEEPDRELWT